MHLNLNLINREYEGWGGFGVLEFHHFCSCWLSYAGNQPLGSRALHIVTAICIWQEERSNCHWKQKLILPHFALSGNAQINSSSGLWLFYSGRHTDRCARLRDRPVDLLCIQGRGWERGPVSHVTDWEERGHHMGLNAGTTPEQRGASVPQSVVFFSVLCRQRGRGRGPCPPWWVLEDHSVAGHWIQVLFL